MMTSPTRPEVSRGPENPTVVGKIGQPFGVHGWVKLQSFCEPVENIVNYDPWWLKSKKPLTSASVNEPNGLKWFTLKKQSWVRVELEAVKFHGKGFIAKFEGVEDRDQAESLKGCEIVVDQSQLPPLPEGDYYWHELEGLDVVTVSGENLGTVREMMPTGANDVLVVTPSEKSIDERRRLIPYLPDRVVESVDLQGKVITVEWDTDF